MALSVTAVSISVSPLRIDEEDTDMFITSAPSRLPASSNEAWVRVEASKNRLISVRPRSAAVFFSIWRLRVDEFLGEIEQADDVGMRKPLDAQQMTAAEDECGLVAQCSLKRDRIGAWGVPRQGRGRISPQPIGEIAAPSAAFG